ncbi:MAG: ABC transporter substrate-binding protein, partial [Acidimicrobiia bacterium]
NRAARSLGSSIAVLALVTVACGTPGREATTPPAPDQTTAPAGEATTAPAPDQTTTPAAEPAEGEPIKLGMATTLSGAIALFGEANRDGAQLAVDELNEAGGVLGREVELIVRDDMAQPEEGAAQARDLIISEGVSALLGPVSSGVALAITEISAERQVPLIVHTSNTEALTVNNFQPYLFSVVPNTGMEARAQAIDLASSPFAVWATISPNYEFGQRQTATFVDTLTQLNPDAQIVEQQWPELGETDFQPFITALLARGPEAVYSPLFAGDLIAFTRQAEDLGFFDQVYFTALYETDALQELGDQHDLTGIRAYSRCPFTIDTPQMATFVTNFQAEFGRVPSDWACMAYDAVKLWAEVVEEAGSLEPDSFVSTAEGFEFTTLRGDTYIRELDHQAAVASYIGELEFSDPHGFYVYGSINEVPAEEIWLSEEEVEAARAGG